MAMTHKAGERACAETFIEWYNKETGASYRIQDVEDFPDLKRNKGEKWDYVAQQGTKSAWIAIEVKELVLWPYWKDLCTEITQKLGGRVKDTFLLHFPPRIDLRRGRKREHLTQVLANVIANKATTIESSNLTDLSPEGAKLFLDWPKVKIDTWEEYQQWGGYRPAKGLS